MNIQRRTKSATAETSKTYAVPVGFGADLTTPVIASMPLTSGTAFERMAEALSVAFAGTMLDTVYTKEVHKWDSVSTLSSIGVETSTNRLGISAPLGYTQAGHKCSIALSGLLVTNSCTNTFKMIQSLPLELIDAIVRLAVKDSSLLFFANKFFKNRDTAARGVGKKRILELNGVFQNMNILSYSMCTPKIVRLSCARIRSDMSWSGTAVRAAYKSGDTQVLDHVVSNWKSHPKKSIPMIARFNRRDLFFDWVMNQSTGCALAEWMEYSLRYLSSGIAKACTCSAYSFVEYFVVPALLGGSIDMLKAVENHVMLRKLWDQCTWYMLFRSKMHVLRMVCAAGCADNAAEMLDYISEKITESGLHRKDTVCRHVAATILLFVNNGTSRSGVEWAMRFGEDCKSMLDGVRHDGRRAICVFSDTSMVVESSKIFSTLDIDVYRLLRSQCQDGGWMSSSASYTCISGSVGWTVIRRIRSHIKNNTLTPSVLELMEECVVDVSRDYIFCGGRWLGSIIIEMKRLLDQSVASAYEVALRIQQIYSDAEGSGSRKDRLLRGKGWFFLYQLLERAIESKNNPVVSMCISPGGLLNLQDLSYQQRRNLVSKACASDNEWSVTTLARCGIEFDETDIFASMKAGRLRATSSILENRPSLSSTEVGKYALALGDQTTIRVAAENNCFDGDTDLLSQARNITEGPPAKKRRFLPSCFTS